MECRATEDFSKLAPGPVVTLKDEQGRVLASSQLEASIEVKLDTESSFDAVVTGSYVFKIEASQAEFTLTSQQIKAQVGQVDLTVG